MKTENFNDPSFFSTLYKLFLYDWIRSFLRTKHYPVFCEFSPSQWFKKLYLEISEIQTYCIYYFCYLSTNKIPKLLRRDSHVQQLIKVLQQKWLIGQSIISVLCQCHRWKPIGLIENLMFVCLHSQREFSRNYCNSLYSPHKIKGYVQFLNKSNSSELPTIRSIICYLKNFSCVYAFFSWNWFCKNQPFVKVFENLSFLLLTYVFMDVISSKTELIIVL